MIKILITTLTYIETSTRQSSEEDNLFINYTYKVHYFQHGSEYYTLFFLEKNENNVAKKTNFLRIYNFTLKIISKESETKTSLALSSIFIVFLQSLQALYKKKQFLHIIYRTKSFVSRKDTSVKCEIKHPYCPILCRALRCFYLLLTSVIPKQVCL